MDIKEIISERCLLEEKHLYPNCNRIYTADGGCYDTTQDTHPCEYSYKAGVEREDNGMGYWIIKCPYFIQIDTRRLYDEWIQSEGWKRIASAAKKQAGYKCEMCGSAYNLCVHHTSYDNICREDKHPDDIVVLCKECHRKVHEQDIQAKRKRVIPAKHKYRPSDDTHNFINKCMTADNGCEILLKYNEWLNLYRFSNTITREYALLAIYHEYGFIPTGEWEEKDTADLWIAHGFITCENGVYELHEKELVEYITNKEKEENKENDSSR